MINSINEFACMRILFVIIQNAIVWTCRIHEWEPMSPSIFDQIDWAHWLIHLLGHVRIPKILRSIFGGGLLPLLLEAKISLYCSSWLRAISGSLDFLSHVPHAETAGPT